MEDETDSRRKPKRRDWESFIRVWQTSRTVAEVCEKTGYKDGTARRYAWTLRKRGVELRQQDDENPQRSKEDWDELRQLATQLGEQPDTDAAVTPPEA